MIKTAIILAGGFGTRLKDVVSDLPKPMAPVNGTPFLTYLLNYLQKYGIQNVIISTGFLSEKISTYYKNKFKQLNIIYSHEEEPLGTGGGIRLALEKSQDENVLILNGDSFFNLDIKSFCNSHLISNSQVSLALRKVNDVSRYGEIQTQENRIIAFNEKSTVAKPGLINAGVYIINKEIFLTNTGENLNFSIEKDFFAKHLTSISMSGFEFDNYFIDIGIPEDYKKVQNDFKESEYR